MFMRLESNHEKGKHMPHKLLKLIVALLLGFGPTGLQAQESVNATGGNSSGGGPVNQHQTFLHRVQNDLHYDKAGIEPREHESTYTKNNSSIERP